MSYREVCKENLIQPKLKGQCRPFIDENLQLQIPTVETSLDSFDIKPSYYSHLLSHYAHSSTSPLFTDIQRIELEKAMYEAQHFYQSWKELQHRLACTAEKHLASKKR